MSPLREARDGLLGFGSSAASIKMCPTMLMMMTSGGGGGHITCDADEPHFHQHLPAQSVMVPIEEEEVVDLSPLPPSTPTTSSSSNLLPLNTTTSSSSSTFTRATRSSSSGSATSFTTSVRSSRSLSTSTQDCPTTPLSSSSCPAEMGSGDAVAAEVAAGINLTNTASNTTIALGEKQNAHQTVGQTTVVKSENALPVKHLGAAKKPPTLEDIAARMKLDGCNKENSRSPDMTASSQAPAAARGRLGLTGRLNSQPGLPYPTQASLTSSSASASASEMDSPPSNPKPLVFGEPPSSQGGVEMTTSSSSENRSRSQSPSKRLPSLLEIRERMNRKAAAAAAAAAGGTTTANASSNNVKTASGLGISLHLKSNSNPLVKPVVSNEKEEEEEKKKEDEQKEKVSTPPSPTKALATAASGNPSTPSRPTGHPLQHKWTLYFDSTTFNPSASGPSKGTEPTKPGSTPSTTSADSYEATLKNLGAYLTVESFMSVFSKLRRPSQLERNSHYHLFKDGIRPLWEDEGNGKGGKWVLTLMRAQHSALLDRSWMWLVLALIGEELDEENDVTGAVVSTRAKGDRISLWLRNAEDTDLVNRMGTNLVKLLDLEKEPGMHLEFVPNPMRGGDAGGSSTSTSTTMNKYISISNPLPSMHHQQQQGMDKVRSQPIGIFQPPTSSRPLRGASSTNPNSSASTTGPTNAPLPVSPSGSHHSSGPFRTTQSPTRGEGPGLSTSPSRLNPFVAAGNGSPTKFGTPLATAAGEALSISPSRSQSGGGAGAGGFDSTFGTGGSGMVRRGSEQGTSGVSRPFGKLASGGGGGGAGSSAFSSLSTRSSFSGQGGGVIPGAQKGSPSPHSPNGSPTRKNSLAVPIPNSNGNGNGASSSSNPAFASLSSGNRAWASSTSSTRTSQSPTKSSFFAGPGTAFGSSLRD